MDPELARLFSGEPGALTIKVTLIVHGATIVGDPCHPSAWGKHLNVLVDAQAPDHPDYDPLAVAFLKQQPADDDHDVERGFGTLRDVTIFPADGHPLTASYLRVDLEHVGAWWLQSAERAVAQAQPKNLGA
jgi:hypothetical protein